MHWLKIAIWGDLQQPTGALGLLLGAHLVTMGVRQNPWGAMMLLDLMEDCKISPLEVHCSRQILCKMDLLKGIKFYCLRQCTSKRG